MVSIINTKMAKKAAAPSTNGGSLKRKHDDVESDVVDEASENTAKKQQKRRRVTFDNSVDIHILPDASEKSLELVGEEVRRALEKHSDGDNGAYDTIRALFAAKPTQADAPLSGLLEKYVIALTNVVPLLAENRTGLVHAIIDSSWIARNDEYYKSYRTLLRSLLSVNPGFAGAILTMLVDMFVELPSPHVRQKDDPAISRARMGDRVHEVLKTLLRQMQMSSTLLGPILVSTFPFPTDTTKAHVQYIRNMLRVSEYCPEIKGQILSVVTDKLVKIDVQIQVDMEDLEDDIEDDLMERLDEDDEEDEDADISDDESVSSEEELEPEELRLKELKENVKKLDAIMDLLFEHYSSVVKDGDHLHDVFQSLISQFENIILPTYRSRHTQFLLFHFSQKSPELIDMFSGSCTTFAFDQRLPQILCTSAAAYLASFIARGAHVSSFVVRNVFQLLCHKLETLRSAQEPGCKAPDLRRYGAYYAIAQSLLYMFCFRWRDLIVTPTGLAPTDQEVLDHEDEDFTWYNDMQQILRRNIFSKLNPLKICAPTIVEQFARMAHHLRFLYVFPLIATNKRIRLSRELMGGGYMDGVGARETALTMKKGEHGFLLDAYFPFDPYTLPRSKKWIEEDYVEWKPVPGMHPPMTEEQDEDDSGDESDDEEEEDEEDVDSDSELGNNGHIHVQHDDTLDDTDDSL